MKNLSPITCMMKPYDYLWPPFARTTPWASAPPGPSAARHCRKSTFRLLSLHQTAKPDDPLHAFSTAPNPPAVGIPTIVWLVWTNYDRMNRIFAFRGPPGQPDCCQATFDTYRFTPDRHITTTESCLSRPTQASQPAHSLVASVWPGQWIREKYRYRQFLAGVCEASVGNLHASSRHRAPLSEPAGRVLARMEANQRMEISRKRSLTPV